MPDYQGVFIRKRRENLDIVKSQIRDGHILDSDLEIKINNHAERWSGVLTVQDIIRDFSNTITVPTFLAKDPSKQNLTEGIAKDYLEQLPEIEKVSILNKSGLDSWMIIDGRLDRRNNFTENERKGHKTIDFNIRLANGKNLMAAHKYTKDTGGAQDNQGNDLLDFAINANSYTGDEYIFVAIGDGEYYNVNKLKSIENKAPNVIVCNSESLVQKLKERGVINLFI